MNDDEIGLAPKALDNAKCLPDSKQQERAREILGGLPGYDRLSDADQAAAVRDLIAFEKRGPRLVAKARLEDGKLTIGSLTNDEAVFAELRLANIFGSSSQVFANREILKMFRYFRDAKENPEAEINAALGFIEGMEARNETEGMLLTQMAMTNHAAVEAMGRMERTPYIDQATVLGNLANKFLRTFVAQTEALAKLRRNGVQEVRHIHIDNRGGQAVVAEHIHQGSGNGKQPTGSVMRSAAMLGTDEEGGGVPLRGDEGKDQMPVARRQVPGRTTRQSPGTEARPLHCGTSR